LDPKDDERQGRSSDLGQSILQFVAVLDDLLNDTN